MKTKIVCISDTHHKHSKVIIPDGDVLVHAGDCTNMGSLNDLRDFAKWLDRLPHQNKICIAGNHDFCFQNELAKSRKILENSCTYLHGESAVIDGLKFYGFPWQPRFGHWAFNV